MRASFLVLASLVPLAACTTQVTGGFGGLGGDAPATTWLPTTSPPSSSSSSSGSADPCSTTFVFSTTPSSCTPAAAECGASGSACLATAHAHGEPVFDLRVAQLTLTAPTALAGTGIVHDVFDSAVRINLPSGCNTGGHGTFNILLHVDATTQQVTVGAGRPVQDPHDGYAFLDEAMTLDGKSFPVNPITVGSDLNPACALDTAPARVNLPFFADVSGSSLYTIFPLRALRVSGNVTPDHDCIGAFYGPALDPLNSCQPDDQHRAFAEEGGLTAYIDLEEADTVFVPVIDQSLCVLLAGSAWSDGMSHPHCRRDSTGAISFKGDWCGAANGPATTGCADAVRFAGTFAASGTTIH